MNTNLMFGFGRSIQMKKKNENKTNMKNTKLSITHIKLKKTTRQNNGIHKHKDIYLKTKQL